MPKRQLAGIALGIWALAATPVQAVDSYDVIIRSGTVIDGSGLPAFQGDIAITGGYIMTIGNLDDATARKIIEADGLMVAPGFINIHSHASADGMAKAINTLSQGITTEIINADGAGADDIRAQLKVFASNGLAENIGAYAGFNYAWFKTVGEDNRRATPAEIDAMRAMIEDNLKHGAWGVSAGLDYKPAYYADTDQIISVLTVAQPWRTNFPNHDRLRPEENYSSFKGMQETISIAEQAGMIPVITHMKSQGAEQGNAPAVVDMMRSATQRGTPVFADIYPYLAGYTGLSSLIIPGWALDGGRTAMLERFKHPATRARIIIAAEEAMALRFGGPKGVYILNTGEELTAVMSALNVGEGEAVIQLLEREDMGAILRFGSEDDLRTLLRYEASAIACDCGARAAGSGHPRNWGSFPRVLGHYVRDNKIMRWEEAIRKSTALPATIIGAIDRGYLAAGMHADIVVFNPETIKDNATYAEPNLKSDGIEYVLVNGQVAVAKGELTGILGGTILLRKHHMPSRPMTQATDRSASAHAASQELSITIDVTQRGTDRHAQGLLQIKERTSGTTWTASELGVLQHAPDWVSFTAIIQSDAGDVRPITVTLDRARVGYKDPIVIIEFFDGKTVILETIELPVITVNEESR